MHAAERRPNAGLAVPAWALALAFAFPAMAPAQRSDDFFPERELASFWRFLDPLAAQPASRAQLTMTGTNVLIAVPAGTSHDLWKGTGNRAPRILQPVENTDFSVEAKFESIPAAKYQLQGVIVEERDDKFLRFCTYHTGTALQLFVAFIDGGSSFVHGSVAPAAGVVPRYLRVQRSGDTWTYRYSGDGADWRIAKTFARTIVAREVGLYAGNHDPSPAYTAIIDYFANTAQPIDDPDAYDPSPAPPALRDLAVTASETEAVVSWTTDRPATSELMFGTSSAHELGTLLDEELVTAHQLRIANLAAGETYHCAVTSMANDGGRATSSDVVFATGASVPPAISGVSAAPTDVSCRIAWFTDLPADSLLECWPAAGGPTVTRMDGALVNRHGLEIDGLAPATAYRYRVTSATAAGLAARSPTLEFATAQPAPPIVSAVRIDPAATTATVTWLTDVPATSDVAYGPTAAYEGGAVTDPSLVIEHRIALANLAPDSTYHLAVRSVSAGGVAATSSDCAFRTDAPDPSGIRSDDFNHCALDESVWTVVDPLNDASFALTGAGSNDARVAISVPAGIDHDLWKGGNRAPRLMQEANDTDLELEARFDSRPAARYQIQGIIAQESPTNYMRFDFYSTGSVLRLYSTYFVNDTPPSSSWSKDLAIPEPPLYLKVKRAGSTWKVSYSTDGASWVQTFSIVHPMVVRQVGVYAANAGTAAPAFTGLVDYFFSTAFPIVPEDGAASGGGPFRLDATASGQGAVRIGPDRPSYACGDEVTIEAVAEQGWAFSGWAGAVAGTENPRTIAILGDTAVSATFVPAVADPTISDVQVAVAERSATVTWQTDLAATSAVAYGPTAAHETGALSDPALVTAHRIVIADLDPGATYHFEIRSETASGGSAATPDATFATLAAGIRSDDFNAFNLDAGIWQLVDPRRDARIASRGVNGGDAAFTLTVPATMSHDAWTSGNWSARIVQEAPNADFAVEVKFASRPSARYQIQGILVEESPKTFLRFDFYSTGSKLKAFAASIVNLAATVHQDLTIAPPPGPLYLRVERAGDVWTQRYSIDGIGWTVAAQFARAIAVKDVGVFAGNHPAMAGVAPPEFTAVVDYFAVTPGFDAIDDAATNVVDGLPPYLYHIVANTVHGEGSASIELSWSADEPAAAALDFGLTPEYELPGVSDGSLVLDRAAVLEDLDPDAIYYLRISARDAAGNASERAFLVDTGSANGPAIRLWYGDVQRFGDRGVPQRWVNILGTVSDLDGVSGLTYSLNGGPERPLDRGPDLRRLARQGDFNCELGTAELLIGQNTVALRAVDALGNTSSATVQVHFTDANRWPLPYAIDWSAAASIHDVAQPVDGRWEITPAGLHIAEPWYDRLVGIGDLAWNSYEIAVPITIHGIDRANGDPFPSNGPAVGILTLWPGHDADAAPDGRQPHEDFTPFGAGGWYRWNAGGTYDLEIYRYVAATDSIAVVRDTSKTIVFGRTYVFKMRVAVAGGVPSYKLKLWEQGLAEPDGWSLQAQGQAGDPTSGSFLLLAHHVDATFGNVTVTPAE